MSGIGERAAGVRVLEWANGGIAAAYAGWLLRSMGADVTRLVAPEDAGDDLDRRSPVQLALDFLATGKTSGPLPRTAADFDALAGEYDVVIGDDPGVLEAVAGPLAELVDRHPRLVVGLATTFGLDGPYAGCAGTELDAQALSGVAWALGEADREPLSLPPGVVGHQGGAMLAAGCLLALGVRDDRGTGRIVDVALCDVLASYVAGNCRLYIHHGLDWHRSGRRASGSGGAYPYVILPCKDGEVCICGRTRDEWRRLVHVMGDPAWAAEPRYQSLRAMGTQYPEEVDALMRPWLAKRTMAELEALALANNLIVSPICGFAEVLATPQYAGGDFLHDAEVAGHHVRTPSLPFRALDARAASEPNRASSLLRCAPPPPRESRGDRPLAGVRVLDFGWVWSAPWVGTILGELGAEVIKVEHAGRPDNLRLAGKVIREGRVVEGPTTEMSPMYHQVNHGKLGVTLNAKEPRAAELIKALAGKSDLVIENMSPGSMERSGLGFDALRAFNARLVMLSMSAAGQFGALSGMRAYAPTMSSFVGMEALVGYAGEASIGALNFGLGDPNASAHALAAVLAALRRARSTGEGCYIDFSQVEALLCTLTPYLLDTQVRGVQTPTMGNAHADMAPHGVYPAAGADAWLTIAVANDEGWRALVPVAAGEAWTADPRYASVGGRLANRTALDVAIAGWTATQDRDGLVAQLRGAGVASSPVLSIAEMWRDPHFAARRVKHPVDIPFYGREELFRAPWRFSDFEPRIDSPGPSLGQDNDRVFGELLGMPTGEIAALKQAGVIQ